jgi:hypothetical protein
MIEPSPARRPDPEAVGKGEELDRAALVRRTLAGAAALAGGGAVIAAVPHLAGSAPSQTQDMRVLNFALSLEYLQEAFYADAVDQGRVSGEVLAFAKAARDHEREHVAVLRRLLGGEADDPPRFTFGDATAAGKTFIEAAVAIEELAIRAYNGQVANMTPSARAAGARVVSVDARHAGWARALGGSEPAPGPTDPGMSAPAVSADLAATGFLAEPNP